MDKSELTPGERAAKLKRLIEVKKEGFAGIMPNGNLVDRREHPEAAPIPANPFLGVPKPKKLPQ